jgi:hypothetical protein
MSTPRRFALALTAALLVPCAPAQKTTDVRVSTGQVLGGVSGRTGGGSLSLPFALPNSTGMLGVDLNVQGLFLDAAAVQGVSMSNAVQVWIG